MRDFEADGKTAGETRGRGSLKPVARPGGGASRSRKMRPRSDHALPCSPPRSLSPPFRKVHFACEGHANRRTSPSTTSAAPIPSESQTRNAAAWLVSQDWPCSMITAARSPATTTMPTGTQTSAVAITM
jgi:hypothetical protein